MSSVDARSLWAQLTQAGLVHGEAPTETTTITPWYVRAMLGIGGWIGAMFLLGFVGAGFAFVMKSAASALFVGALLCAAATVMFRGRPNGDFAGQFALAVSMAGQVLIGVGLAQLLPSRIAVIALLMALLQMGLFLLVPNFLHRVLSAISGTAALVMALGNWGLHPYTQAIVFAAFGWVWLNEFSYPGRSTQMRAIGYGLVLLLIADLVMESVAGMGRSLWLDRAGEPLLGAALAPWISAALIGATIVWVVWKLLIREGFALTKEPGLAAIGGAVLVALVSVKAPGIGVTLVILLIGYANGNRVLAGLGIFSLLAYLSHYYYMLQITLLEKSALLVFTGIVLITARLALKSRWPIGERTGEPHA
jgi:uncharacterized membrane protein